MTRDHPPERRSSTPPPSANAAPRSREPSWCLSLPSKIDQARGPQPLRLSRTRFVTTGTISRVDSTGPDPCACTRAASTAGLTRYTLERFFPLAPACFGISFVYRSCHHPPSASRPRSRRHAPHATCSRPPHEPPPLLLRRRPQTIPWGYSTTGLLGDGVTRQWGYPTMGLPDGGVTSSERFVPWLRAALTEASAQAPSAERRAGVPRLPRPAPGLSGHPPAAGRGRGSRQRAHQRPIASHSALGPGLSRNAVDCPSSADEEAAASSRPVPSTPTRWPNRLTPKETEGSISPPLPWNSREIIRQPGTRGRGGGAGGGQPKYTPPREPVLRFGKVRANRARHVRVAVEPLGSLRQGS